MENKRVIFLDVDGVLNCQEFYTEQHRYNKFKPWKKFWLIKKWIKYVFNGFEYKYTSAANYKPDLKHNTYKYRLARFKDQTCQKRLGWLDSVCKDTGAKIVISSVWRTHFDLSEWNRAFYDLGFDNLDVIGTTFSHHPLRGDEIKDWLDKYPQDDYAIIDDDSDMREDQQSNFFWVDAYAGLTPNTCYRIKRHFLYKEDVDVMRHKLKNPI
jgi:hypothetical protein